MKQKVSRGQLIKTENASSENTPAQRGDVLWQKTPSENGSFKRSERLTGGSRPSGLNFQKEAAELDGAREPRWSPAAIHGEAGGSGGTSVFSASFRVGGWWWWSPGSTTSAAMLAPADGDSGGCGPRRREL